MSTGNYSSTPYVNPCSSPMTRGALISGRNASMLKVNCHYTITDFSAGTLGACEIVMHATAPDVLSMDVMVKTTFDNASWSGRYDIDQNRMKALFDNVENEVTGHLAVNAFPWGMSTVTQNIVFNATITVSAGAKFQKNIVGERAVIKCEGGSTSTNNIAAGVGLTVKGGSFYENTLGEDCDVIINSGSNFENQFSCSCIYVQVGTGVIRYSSIAGTGRITNGNTTISNCHFGNASTLNTTDSTGTISNSSFEYVPFGSGLKNISILNISQSTFSSGAAMYADGCANLRMFRLDMSGGARLLASAGSILNVDYSNIGSYGYMRCFAGNLRVRFSSVESSSYILSRGGTNSVTSCSVSGGSNIRYEGTCEGCRIMNSVSMSGGGLYMKDATKGTFYYCTVSSVGQMFVKNRTDAKIYYSSSNDYSAVQIEGTTGTGKSTIYYSSARSRGYIKHINIGADMRFYSISAASQGLCQQTGGTVASNLYYSSFSSYFYFIGALTGGTRHSLFGTGRMSFSGMPTGNGTGSKNWT